MENFKKVIDEKLEKKMDEFYKPLTNIVKQCEDRLRFEVLVKTLAEQSYHGNEEVDIFEQKLTNMGFKEVYFGVAKEDWDRIEIVKNKGELERLGIRFYAEYYDGFQAPFDVFKWNEDVEILEELLKETSLSLYDMYLDALKEYE